ncbi:MAM and fibronectin type III domain-containing protein 1-like [Orbicella faveolata]|uniref:MAM and fibronectin type III domain-containing protein 1-like n=1 Tax=Orbicella faveolata TaxID=48498 RepID=UPI0009E4089E|nr:MAM and fibronectin type III domain-containing protein 1-like [Orbicella faveolata]
MDASYQHDWNATVGNISSTTVNVSWLPLNTSSLNSTDIYGYVAVCIRRGSSDILLLSVENASSSNTMVRNLKPYSNYEVKVVALLKDRVTNVTTLKSSEKTDIRTKEGVPGYVPWVYGYDHGPNSLEINWSPIPEEDTHGVLLGYVVYYRRYGSYENFTTVKVNASTRELRITGLLEATRYEIKVAGRTPSGEGPLRTTYESTACAGNFSGITGEINITSSSYYSGHCYLELHSPLVNSSILLVVQRFQMQYCWSGSVSTRNGQSRNICGQKEPFAILILGGYARVRLNVYQHYYYHTTLKALYFVRNNTGIDASYQHGWNVTVGNISPTTVNVSWLPLNTSSLNSTDIYGYVAVCIRRGSSDILLLSVENASSSNTMVRNLKPYSNYEVKVVALLNDRVTNVATLKSSEKTDIRTKEGVPGYVPRVYGYNLGPNSLEINWSPIPEEDTHGVLLGYVVYFRRYGSYENFTTVKVNASTRVLRITGLMEATRYEIKVAGRTSVGEGPLRTRYVSTACGQTFNGTTSEINVITSYYSGYCIWEIHSPLVNSSVLLVVQRFQMQYCW